METPKNDQLDKNIDDESFQKLVESEYEKQGRPVDELAKQRIWEALSSKLKTDQANKNQRLNIIKLSGALAACFAGILATFQYFEFSNPEPFSGQRIKGTHAGVGYRIGMYLQEEGGKLTALEDLSKKKEGEVIVPFVETDAPVPVVLLRQTADEQYEAVSSAEVTEAGKEHYFARDGEATGIYVEALVETYCVLVADSMPTMGAIIAELPEIKDKAKLSIECFSL
jgi:hypothetical protein